MRETLASGLGGGLDSVNASVIYFALKTEGKPSALGSVRQAPQSSITGPEDIFAESGCWVSDKSRVLYVKPNGPTRYPEPHIAREIGENVLFLSYMHGEKFNVQKLREAIIAAKKKYEIKHMFFVDGGGDSLTFRPEDASGNSENYVDPFYGGDSATLEALSGLDNVYMGVVSVGLDIKEVAFAENLERLRSVGAYYGRVNLRTGEKEDYRLNHLLSFSEDFLPGYFNLAERVMVIKEEDLQDSSKTMSHTGVVTYHALKGNYGMRRTFINWEPEHNGVKGTEVKPDHTWMYFFDPSKIHELKLRMNKMTR
jgi:hypothetical protein